MRSLIWLGLALGSTVGSFIPLLWGDTTLSMSSILLGALGGIAGIWGGYKLGSW